MNSILNTNRGKFILGVAVCFAVSALAVLIECLIPGDLLGASIIALFWAQ